MFYIADLHVHSHYSRATSKNLNLESLYQWANIKGIQVVGTGDFTHPAWFKELENKLIPDNNTGFYVLKNPPPPLFKYQHIDVKFCLTTEISSIYKYGEKVRKNHNLLYAPDLETVKKINYQLSKIGNLKSDGRPILGLSARDLLEIVKTASNYAYLIPAHIWTPWFSTLGSKSGYNSIKDCFRDLTSHIFAVETGLSSDPQMNWRVSELDNYTLISNSDAHSPQKLGREANMFNTDLTYNAMFEAIKTKKGFLGTLEFFPEEGKYHLDGHRNCNVCTIPIQTQEQKNICLVCKKALTVGVLHRVELLADRPENELPKQTTSFIHIVPLPEIIGEIKNLGINTKGVEEAYQHIIGLYGNEFNFIKNVPLENIEKDLGIVYKEAIKRLRAQKAIIQAGYDGVYGKILFFQAGEIEKLHGQLSIFQQNLPIIKRKKIATKQVIKQKINKTNEKFFIHPKQQEIIQNTQGALLVTAGPGTGKTHTLIAWIANAMQKNESTKVLAITFTNKAVEEIKIRINQKIPQKEKNVIVGTFHSIAYTILQEEKKIQQIYTPEERKIIIQQIFHHQNQNIGNILTDFFEKNILKKPKYFEQYIQPYLDYLSKNKATDVLTLIYQMLKLWQKDDKLWKKFQKKYTHFAVDELQDINYWQYQWIKMLSKDKNVLCIGDPNQAIYQFRGSDAKYFFQLKKELQPKTYILTKNYRSTHTIVQAASKVIAHNTDYIDMQWEKNEAQGLPIQLTQHKNAFQEAQHVAKKIQQLVSKDDNLALGTHDEHQHTYADIAILFRTKQVGKMVFQSLQKENIPIHFHDEKHTTSEIHKVLITIFKIFVMPHNTFSLQVFLVDILKFSLLEAQRCIKKYIDNQHQFTANLCKEMPITYQKKYIVWHKFYHTYKKCTSIQNMLQDIFKMYITPIYKEDNDFFLQKDILDIAQRYTCKKSFLHDIILHKTNNTQEKKSEKVHLLTFHAAKGIEFPIVFIVGAEENITPLKYNNKEEERRLFYVALTRAKDQIMISYASQRKMWGNTQQSTLLSRFVEEIPSKLIKKSKINTSYTKQLKII